MSRLALSVLALLVGSSAFAVEISGAVHVPMRGITAGTFYLEAEVGSLGAVEFLVDTGSGYTAIDTQMLADLERGGDAVFVKRLEGIMADGSRKIVPVYRISEMHIGSCVLRDVEAAVFGSGTRPILGMRALSRMAPFTFSTNPPGISLGRCDSVILAGGDERPDGGEGAPIAADRGPIASERGPVAAEAAPVLPGAG